MSIRLVMAGGHLTPALALIQECNKHGAMIQVIGAETPATMHLEKNEVESQGATYTTIPPYKYDRHHPLTLITNLGSGVRSVTQAIAHLKAFKPQAVIVFGGYVSLPLTLAAWSLHLPVILHEQTMNPGIASRLISPFCRSVFLAYPLKQALITKHSTVVGNLVRAEMYTPQPPPAWYKARHKDRPLLFITGGNQGSASINQIIVSLYPELVQKYLIIHQYGGNTSQDSHSIEAGRLQIPETLRHLVVLKPWFTAAEMSWLLDKAHLVICRAGANTISELMIKGVPAIIIPLKRSAGNEQMIQAQTLVNHKMAEIISQENMSSTTLQQTLMKMEREYPMYQQQAQKYTRLHPLNSVAIVYQTIEAVANRLS